MRDVADYDKENSVGVQLSASRDRRIDGELPRKKVAAGLELPRN